jgi:hypothetical protein
MVTIVLSGNTATTSAELQDAVESIGYTVQQIATTEASSKMQQADVMYKKRAFLLSLVGTLPI